MSWSVTVEVDSKVIDTVEGNTDVTITSPPLTSSNADGELVPIPTLSVDASTYNKSLSVKPFTCRSPVVLFSLFIITPFPTYRSEPEIVKLPVIVSPVTSTNLSTS